jgi:hypothetical protein
MPRKTRPLDRESGVVRDASLIVIASEDTFAVKQYFARFKTRRVQVEVIATEDDRSAPNHVMRRLDDFRKEFVTEYGDTFWICIDRDRWDEQSLSTVLRECAAKGYNVALSVPCFELWLVLHHEASTLTSSDKCAEVCARLQELIGGYGTQCCRTMKLTSDMVETAMDRARLMDNSDMVPTAPLTRVYKILDAMIAKDAILLHV